MDSTDVVPVDETRLPALPGPRFSDRLRRSLGLSVRMMCLDPAAARELAARPQLTGPALLLAYLGTLGANFPFVHSLTEVAVTSVGFLMFIMPLMGVQHLIAKTLGSKCTYPQFVRTMYCTNAMYLAGFLPVIGAPIVVLAMFWDCVVTTCAMASVTGMSIARSTLAFAAVTLPLLWLLL